MLSYLGIVEQRANEVIATYAAAAAEDEGPDAAKKLMGTTGPFSRVGVRHDRVAHAEARGERLPRSDLGENDDAARAVGEDGSAVSLSWAPRGSDVLAGRAPAAMSNSREVGSHVGSSVTRCTVIDGDSPS